MKNERKRIEINIKNSYFDLVGKNKSDTKKLTIKKSNNENGKGKIND